MTYKELNEMLIERALEENIDSVMVIELEQTAGCFNDLKCRGDLK